MIRSTPAAPCWRAATVADRNNQRIYNLSFLAAGPGCWSPTTVNQVTGQFLYYHHYNVYLPCDPATAWCND